MRKSLILRANTALGLIFAFLLNNSGPMPMAQAQEFYLPAPGQMVALSPAYNPAVLKGIKLDPKNPFRFHFFVDTGDDSPSFFKEGGRGSLKQESSKLIKYFLASLTIPEKDLWVNLSPYEKDRVVPQSFGQTEMGRDLLAEDYILKQITASLIYPESKLGKEFWAKVYAQAQLKYGTTNIPINTFNKVWIVPDKAVVYENGGTAFVLENHLKVMLEQDYLSIQKHNLPLALGSQIVREIVIPALTKEVNQGKNFSQLRQVFYSLILATWYKKKVKDSILNKIYSDQNKIAGVGYKNNSLFFAGSPNNSLPLEGRVREGGNKDVEIIYQQYLKAFKKGVYNYIKEEPTSTQTIPRKYFSGGVTGFYSNAITYQGPREANAAQLTKFSQVPLTDITAVINLNPSMSTRRRNSKGSNILAGKKILLVSDAEGIKKRIESILKKEGATIEDAVNIQRAFLKIKESRKKRSPYDLAAIDAHMPNLSGLVLTQQIRNNFPTLPVVSWDSRDGLRVDWPLYKEIRRKLYAIRRTNKIHQKKGARHDLLSKRPINAAMNSENSELNKEKGSETDGAMKSERITFIQGTNSDRNNDMFGLMVSPAFKVVTGIDLRHGASTIFDIGVSSGVSVPGLANRIQRLGNPHLQLIATELPSVVPKGYIRSDRFLNCKALDQFNLRLWPIKDIMLVVDENYTIHDVAVEYYQNEYDRTLRFRRAAFSRETLSYNYGDRQESNSILLENLLGMLKDKDLTPQNLKRMIESPDSKNSDKSFTLEPNPLQNKLAKMGVNLQVTDLPDIQNIKNPAIYLFSHVLGHYPSHLRESLWKRIVQNLRDKDVIIVKDFDGSPDKENIVLYQKRKGILRQLETLHISLDGLEVEDHEELGLSFDRRRMFKLLSKAVEAKLRANHVLRGNELSYFFPNLFLLPLQKELTQLGITDQHAIDEGIQAVQEVLESGYKPEEQISFTDEEKLSILEKSKEMVESPDEAMNASRERRMYPGIIIYDGKEYKELNLGSQGIVYYRPQDKTVIKVFDRVPDIRRAHLDRLLQIVQMLRQEKPDEIVNMQAVVNITSDMKYFPTEAILMDWQKGRTLEWYTDWHRSEAEKLVQKADNLNQWINEKTGGLADQRWHRSTDEELYDNFIVKRGKNIVNVDPIDMKALIKNLPNAKKVGNSKAMMTSEKTGEAVMHKTDGAMNALELSTHALAQHSQEIENQLVGSPLHFMNAGALPWEELIRDRHQISPMVQLDEDQRYGNAENTANYWLNQFDVREEILQFIAETFLNGGVSLKRWVQEIEKLHGIAIGGATGERWYQSGTFMFAIRNGSNNELKSDVKGALQARRDQKIDMQRIGSRLKTSKNILEDMVFVRGTATLEDFLNKLSSFYWALLFSDEDEVDPKVPGHYLFKASNNAFIMNLANAFLRLYGLHGIEHGKIDFCRSSKIFKRLFIKKVLAENGSIDLKTPIISLLRMSKGKVISVEKELGGINLNPAQMSMQVKKDGQDFKFDFNGTQIDAAQVAGATFTIDQMTPVTNLPQVLGLNTQGLRC